MGKQCKVNEKYFSSWSPNMAYILGFTVADGALLKRKSGQLITRWRLAIKDIEILEFIRNEIAPKKKIYKYNYEHSICELLISNKYIFQDLESHGLCCRKTGKEVLPKHLPAIYNADFIRGIFDGDGCICIYKIRDKYQGRYFSITSASKNFLELLKQTVKPNMGSICEDKQSNCYKWSIHNKHSLKEMHNFLYNQESFSLKRKKQKFIQAIS